MPKSGSPLISKTTKCDGPSSERAQLGQSASKLVSTDIGTLPTSPVACGVRAMTANAYRSSGLTSAKDQDCLCRSFYRANSVQPGNLEM